MKRVSKWTPFFVLFICFKQTVLNNKASNLYTLLKLPLLKHFNHHSTDA